MLQPVVILFNNNINQQNLEGLASLMTDDHCFIDSVNTPIQGKRACLKAWEGFFKAFPDYKNVFEKVAEIGQLVVITGYSQCSDKRLEGPAIWTAEIVNDLVKEWRVYDDTEENRAFLGL